MPSLRRRPCCAPCASRQQRTGQAGGSVSVAGTIGGVLTGYGMTSDQVNQALDAYQNLGTDATSSVLGMLDGGPVDAASLSPIIAIGLSAIPGVGPAAVAAVSAVLPVLDALHDLFSSPAPTCSWKKNWACFQASARPWGPTDPQWQAYGPLVQSDAELVLQAFPWSWIVECELAQIDPNTTDPVLQFRLVFLHAWMANAEYWLNGYQGVDDKALLGIVRDAWNHGHDSSSSHTFQAETPQGGPAAWPLFNNWQGCPPPPFGGQASFIEAILSGATADLGTTGTRGAPITISTGPRLTPSDVAVSTATQSALARIAGQVHLTSSATPTTEGPAAVLAAESALGNGAARAAVQSLNMSARTGDPVAVGAVDLINLSLQGLMREPHWWVAYYSIPQSKRIDPLRELSGTMSRGKVQATAGLVSERAATLWAHHTKGLLSHGSR